MRFPAYSLRNNNANIRRVKQRIQTIKSLYQAEPIDFSNDEFSMRIDNGRVIIIFTQGKPSDDVRQLLKSYAFKWSRHSVAWVRKATANCFSASKQLLNQLQTLQTVYPE